MKSIDNPLYTSGPAWKSLGNAYYIYADRIELRCRFPFFTRTLIVKRDDLISIDVFKPPVIRTSFLALKLDLADLSEHVGLKRRSGAFKQLRFTPGHPKEFVLKVREIFNFS